MLLKLTYHFIKAKQIIFSKCGDFDTIEMGDDLGNHFGVFYGDWQVLLFDGFPIHPTVLIALVDQFTVFKEYFKPAKHESRNKIIDKRKNDSRLLHPK